MGERGLACLSHSIELLAKRDVRHADCSLSHLCCLRKRSLRHVDRLGETCLTACGRIVSQWYESSTSLNSPSHDERVKRVSRRHAESILSILQSPPARDYRWPLFAMRSAASCRHRDGAMPRCCAPDEGSTPYRRMSAAHTDPSLVVVASLR